MVARPHRRSPPPRRTPWLWPCMLVGWPVSLSTFSNMERSSSPRQPVVLNQNFGRAFTAAFSCQIVPSWRHNRLQTPPPLSRLSVGSSCEISNTAFCDRSIPSRKLSPCPTRCVLTSTLDLGVSSGCQQHVRPGCGLLLGWGCTTPCQLFAPQKYGGFEGGGCLSKPST